MRDPALAEESDEEIAKVKADPYTVESAEEFTSRVDAEEQYLQRERAKRTV